MVVWGGFRVWGGGGVLLSHTLAGAVPSACSGLASGFGMGPGVSLELRPPPQLVDAVYATIWCGVKELYGGRAHHFPPPVVGGVFCWLLAISTSQLQKLLLVHVWSINPMVCGGPSQQS